MSLVYLHAKKIIFGLLLLTLVTQVVFDLSGIWGVYLILLILLGIAYLNPPKTLKPSSCYIPATPDIEDTHSAVISEKLKK